VHFQQGKFSQQYGGEVEGIVWVKMKVKVLHIFLSTQKGENMKNGVSYHPKAFFLRPGENTSLLSCVSSGNLAFYFLKQKC